MSSEGTDQLLLCQHALRALMHQPLLVFLPLLLLLLLRGLGELDEL